jgi:hypothetical protein
MIIILQSLMTPKVSFTPGEQFFYFYKKSTQIMIYLETEEVEGVKGVKEFHPYSADKRSSMKISQGMSFFAKREAFLHATDNGIELEYIDEEEEEKIVDIKDEKTIDDGKTINLKTEPFIEVGPDGPIDKNEESKDSTNPFDKVKREYTVNGFKVSKTSLVSVYDIAVLVSDPQWNAEGFF